MLLFASFGFTALRIFVKYEWLEGQKQHFLVVVAQLLSCVRLSETPWTPACQASLSFTVSQSLLRPMSIESMMPSHHLIPCHFLLLLPLVFPSIRVFSRSWLFASGDQNIGVSASASVLPMNIQGWFSLELTGLISLLSRWLSRVLFSSITVWKHQFFSAQPSLRSNSHIFLYMTPGKISIHDFHLFFKIWILFFTIEFWGFYIF